jgi:uncharacterized Zn finger protein (UPF0148 family)
MSEPRVCEQHGCAMPFFPPLGRTVCPVCERKRWERYGEHLARASETVGKCPAWKREVLR